MDTVVIENGSGMIRAGFAGDDGPRAIFPTAVKMRDDGRDSYVGDEALVAEGGAKTKYPIMYGQICNWDAISKIWHHTFYNELRVHPEDCSVLLTEPPCNPNINREKTIQEIFEVFSVKACYLANQSVLSLYSTGRTTGLCIDSGEGVTYSVPVYEGHAINYFVGHLDFGGSNLTSYLTKLIEDKYGKFTTRQERELVRDIKEKLGYVALDFEQEKAKISSSPTYTLPDGKTITLQDELYMCPEALFKPQLIGFEMPGIHELAVNSIKKSNEDMRSALYRNIVLCGGSTLFPSMASRIQKEISLLAPNTEVKVVPSTNHSSWMGGAILASLSTFSAMCIDKAHYEEYGPNIVSCKCF